MFSVRSAVTSLLGAALCAAAPVALQAQREEPPASGDRPTRAPISIGNYPDVAGLRLNFRDRNLEQVRGINATIWQPYEPATGIVRGLSLGLPLTGAGRVDGLAIGVLGASAYGKIRGIALGGIGVGSGGGMRGLSIGGIGVGSGGDLDGITLGGIGAGGGGNARGLIAGGIGAGVGGSMHGIAIGGIGVGAGGGVRGLAIGGIGVGTSGKLSGIAISGIGTGAGGDITGLTISGIGTGTGATMRGIGIAGVGLGAPRLVGGFLAPMVGSLNAHAIVIAPIFFKIEKGGSFRGGALSAVNDVRGTQRGLTIGIVNYARTLHGLQLGVINIIADQKSHSVLPIANWGSGR